MTKTINTEVIEIDSELADLAEKAAMENQISPKQLLSRWMNETLALNQKSANERK